MKRRITLDMPELYRIEVQGEIDRGLVDQFGDVIRRIHSRGSRREILCEVDQAALHGLLRSVYSHGLPLVSVRWIDPARQV